MRPLFASGSKGQDDGNYNPTLRIGRNVEPNGASYFHDFDDFLVFQVTTSPSERLPPNEVQAEHIASLAKDARQVLHSNVAACFRNDRLVVTLVSSASLLSPISNTHSPCEASKTEQHLPENKELCTKQFI